jgi:hypothetical protein
MKEHKTLKIDMSFPGFFDEQLVKMLNSGWVIVDKTVERERYIYYVLSNNFDPDLGKCSY